MNNREYEILSWMKGGYITLTAGVEYQFGPVRKFFTKGERLESIDYLGFLFLSYERNPVASVLNV